MRLYSLALNTYASNPMKHIKIQHYKGGNSKNFYYPVTLINMRLNNNADVSENRREQM